MTGVCRVSSGAVVLGLVLAVGSPGRLAAQVALGTPDGEFAEGFGRIEGIREMSDGRVLVADRAGKLIAFVDFASGTMRPIGRVGQGPHEYELPASLVALPGDRSLLTDLGNMRLIEIEADGTFAKTYPMAQGDGHSQTRVIPRTSDVEGWIYFEPRGPGPGAEVGYVLRWHPDTGAIEEVATFSRARVVNPQGPPPPFALNDQWSVHANGDVVVARAEEYQLLRVVEGERTFGPIRAYDPVRITSADREQFRENVALSALVMDVGRDGSPSGASSPARSMIDQAYPDDVFPNRKGPFSSVSAAPWGEVWVRREVPAGDRPLYDIFDGAGELVRQVEFSEGSRLIGFGPATVYVARVDELGLEYLQRYSR